MLFLPERSNLLRLAQESRSVKHRNRKLCRSFRERHVLLLLGRCWHAEALCLVWTCSLTLTTAFYCDDAAGALLTLLVQRLHLHPPACVCWSCRRGRRGQAAPVLPPPGLEQPAEAKSRVHPSTGVWGRHQLLWQWVCRCQSWELHGPNHVGAK